MTQEIGKQNLPQEFSVGDLGGIATIFLGSLQILEDIVGLDQAKCVEDTLRDWRSSGQLTGSAIARPNETIRPAISMANGVM
ncbi:hypothetical protein L3N51_02307 [Metallosphaera sp. J1]|uniref:hypothetical protein n=1 Tax=Metallosphaera javensis (ex Hofmann et al. 2022) TaxID=99938 RepID=UPI001EDDB48C|nr:hypothetical protein [Metallosphaera javensis (ex Hofmann et al. 2022)]MCG3110010.1 hypothetical protein [Metallosphaera javensis (ex Hofmann et al. 2022)]